MHVGLPYSPVFGSEYEAVFLSQNSMLCLYFCGFLLKKRSALSVSLSAMQVTHHPQPQLLPLLITAQGFKRRGNIENVRQAEEKITAVWRHLCQQTCM